MMPVRKPVSAMFAENILIKIRRENNGIYNIPTGNKGNNYVLHNWKLRANFH